MIEPALPKKRIERNNWTHKEVDTLMSMASVFTEKGKRIRWREIAAATGHHESSCALKYHVVRSRAAGRLTRDLVDADLAVKYPVKRPTSAGAYPVWTADEDARLLTECHGRVIQGHAAWREIAEGFPGRSFYAVRQRYLTLRNHAAGIVRERDHRARPVRSVKRGPVKKQAPPKPQPTFEYETLTAAFFRDPPPGRSALDNRLAGISDPPAVDRRTAHLGYRPPITLATEPLR